MLELHWSETLLNIQRSGQRNGWSYIWKKGSRMWFKSSKLSPCTGEKIETLIMPNIGILIFKKYFKICLMKEELPYTGINWLIYFTALLRPTIILSQTNNPINYLTVEIYMLMGDWSTSAFNVFLSLSALDLPNPNGSMNRSRLQCALYCCECYLYWLSE